LRGNLIVTQLDLLGVKQTFTTKLSWLEPSIVRAFEIIILITLINAANLLGVTSYFVIFAIIFHHYDNLYRALQNEAKPLWLTSLGLNVGGRVLLLGIAIYMGWPIAIFAWYFGVIFLLISSGQWVISHKQNKVRV